MFEDTLGKFVLVIALFAVFVVLGNIFAAGHHAAAMRTTRTRRRGRRGRGRSAAAEPGAEDGAEASFDAREASPQEEGPSFAKRLLPQLALSAVALAVAALALVVMWRVAQGG